MFADKDVLAKGLLAKLNKDVSGVQAAFITNLWLRTRKKMYKTSMMLTVRQQYCTTTVQYCITTARVQYCITTARATA